MGAEAVAAGSISLDPVTANLVEETRERSRHRMNRPAELIAIAMAGTFLVAAVGAALLLPSNRPFVPATAILAVIAYAIASRVEFEVRNGFALPSQLVLVPMLFALPPRVVPLLVAAGYVLGQTVRRNRPLSHVPIVVASAWYSLGPAVVLAVAGSRAPRWHDAPLYVAALAAQFGVDFGCGATWSRLGYGISAREHLLSMRETAFVDVALAPVGLVVAVATIGKSWGVLLVLPLILLLKVFAQERQRRLDHALELSHAYRGTAMLLGEVIEADDEYTGSHSRDVVELVVAVGERLGLAPRARQHVELAALLHDVGKVKMPSELVNKPGPLDEAERALMQTHAIVGEEMLAKIGGLLGEVGHIVRSCHEHWDGRGYPDGLAGERIPLAARIISACDAWSAMTTDRSYRRARSRAEAAAELRSCAGTQFDPQVVEALEAVLAG